MQSNNSKIPVYGLYGEKLISSDPGFVHIEEIATRSSDLGWKIKPHRHSRLFQVICIFDSTLEVSLNDETHTLSGSWIVTIPAGVVHGFRFQANSDGFVLSIDSNFMLQSSDKEYSHIEELYLAPKLIELSSHERAEDPFLHYISLIRQEFETFNTDRSQALSLLSRLALLSLNRQAQIKRVQTTNRDRNSLLVGRFRMLIETHYREHWAVTQYAEKLNISNSTLSRLCYEYYDEGPKSIIQKRVLAEAKRRLIYTRQSNEEIAYTLGFKDHAYFSRFFKTLEGATPGEYRKNADNFH